MAKKKVIISKGKKAMHQEVKVFSIDSAIKLFKERAKNKLKKINKGRKSLSEKIIEEKPFNTIHFFLEYLDSFFDKKRYKNPLDDSFAKNNEMSSFIKTFSTVLLSMQECFPHSEDFDEARMIYKKAKKADPLKSLAEALLKEKKDLENRQVIIHGLDEHWKTKEGELLELFNKIFQVKRKLLIGTKKVTVDIHGKKAYTELKKLITTIAKKAYIPVKDINKDFPNFISETLIMNEKFWHNILDL